MNISFRYIFIYRFRYLLMYYYSFLAQYHNKCLDINLSPLLVPPSCNCGILALRSRDFWDNSNSKTRVRFVYVLPEVLHGEFFIWNKIFSQWNILQILTRNDIFFYDYSNWVELSFNFFKFILVAVSQIFDRVKSVWSANIRKLVKDHMDYGSAATTHAFSRPIDTTIPSSSMAPSDIRSNAF